MKIKQKIEQLFHVGYGYPKTTDVFNIIINSIAEIENEQENYEARLKELEEKIAELKCLT